MVVVQSHRSKFHHRIASAVFWGGRLDLFTARASRTKCFRTGTEDFSRVPAIVGVHVGLSVPEFSKMYRIF